MIDYKKTHWLFWPFAFIWNLVAYILMLTGRFTAVILGIVLIIVGVVLSFTVVGACIGIPLAGLGLLLVVRGLW
jgi:hypothetical protein